MARGYLITTEVESLIVQVYHEHPKKWKAREIRNVVRSILREKSKDNPGLLLKLTTGWPSLGSVHRILTDHKEPKGNSKSSILSVDRPWRLAALSKSDYFIPSEALPLVMEAHKKEMAKDNWLTIREALWMGRLYTLIEPKELVYDWAFLYALWEMIADSKGESFDSSDLDSELIKDVYYARREMRPIELWGIAEKYGDDPEKLKELNLPAEEVDEIIHFRGVQKEQEKEFEDERKHKAKR